MSVFVFVFVFVFVIIRKRVCAKKNEKGLSERIPTNKDVPQ